MELEKVIAEKNSVADDLETMDAWNPNYASVTKRHIELQMEVALKESGRDFRHARNVLISIMKSWSGKAWNGECLSKQSAYLKGVADAWNMLEKYSPASGEGHENQRISYEHGHEVGIFARDILVLLKKEFPFDDLSKAGIH